MRHAKRLPRCLWIVSLACLVSACGEEGAAVDVVAIGQPDALFERGGRLSLPAQAMRGATAEGLVGLAQDGRIIAGVADSWIVTEDGLSYIFRLRDGDWADGSSITAESAKASLREAIGALRGTPLALDLAAIAEIRAMTGRVVELRLSGTQPDLLMLLAQPELGLLRKGRGTGPMQAVRSGKLATLTQISPEKRGLPAVENWQEQVRDLRLIAVPAGRAIERFNAGKANAVLGGRFEDFPLAASTSLSRGAIRLDPVAGLFGLIVLHGDGFLSQPGNREAIAMAIDREAVEDAMGIGGWTPTSRIVAPGTQGATGSIGERWTGLSLAARRETARARVAQWRAGKKDPVRIRIALPAGPGAGKLFALLAADLESIGLVAIRTGEGDAADLRLIDSVARHQRTAWYLNQFNCALQRGLCNSDADRRAAEARTEPDATARAALLAEAEAELTAANVFIPFGPPVRWSLVRGDTTGFAPNRLGYHPLMPLALRPK